MDGGDTEKLAAAVSWEGLVWLAGRIRRASETGANRKLIMFDNQKTQGEARSGRLLAINFPPQGLPM